jgi:hypothetical protein
MVQDNTVRARPLARPAKSLNEEQEGDEDDDNERERFSLEGENRLRAGEKQKPLEPHSYELLRPTMEIRCKGLALKAASGIPGRLLEKEG